LALFDEVYKLKKALKNNDLRLDNIGRRYVMNRTINQTRPCTISESIIQSCKEVKDMREGRTPKRSLSEMFENIEKWSKEEE
jgi:hypothetical protein